MKEGDEAPDFELESTAGGTVSLASFRGKKPVVLCFYPMNRIFGCPSKKALRATEDIAGSYAEIKDAGSELFAVSVDTIESQKKFTGSHNVPYPHLADPVRSTCKRYAGLGMLGLSRRRTILIDRNGIVRRVFTNIIPGRHGREILDAVLRLGE